jgi:hypothetical protein
MNNYYSAGHPKGTICVLRQCAGTWHALALPVTAWREYNGAFSIWRA